MPEAQPEKLLTTVPNFRLGASLARRVEILASRLTLSKSDVMRLALQKGMPLLETENPA